jgi:hypothetical protein
MDIGEQIGTVFQVYDIPSCSHTASIFTVFDNRSWDPDKVCHAGDVLLARMVFDGIEDEGDAQVYQALPFVAIWSLKDGTILRCVDFAQNVARIVFAEDIEIRYPYFFHFSGDSKSVSSYCSHEARKMVAIGRIYDHGSK